MANAKVADNGNEDEDVLEDLTPEQAPLWEFVSLPMTDDHKVSCPFHDDPSPSLKIYSDHFHCYGCGEHGGRVDWLTRVEGMSRAEAIAAIEDWEPHTTSPVATLIHGSDKSTNALTLWDAAGPLRGSIGERYLRETRSIDVDKLPANIHDSLRFHSCCAFGPTPAPCILALMRDPVTDTPTGIQRIGLKVDGDRIVKLDRKMLGKSGVVKLWPISDGVLTVGEGVETTLAAASRVAYDPPLIPAWSAVSSYGLASLPPLAGVRSLIILVDHDREGLAAAARLEACWHAAGREVTQLVPDDPGADFNDVVWELEQ
jgi:hypothetical protein